MNDAWSRLVDQLKLPVIAAPMFLVSGPDLVLAACRSGVIGSLPGPNGRTLEDLHSWFDTITTGLESDVKDGVPSAPWAFNMLTHSTYGRFDAELELVKHFQPRLVITALGGPQRVVDDVHDYGGLVFADVNSPAYARKAVARGADGLVLVSAGAGGHTGAYAMSAFIDEVRSFFSGPVVAAGAISTGRSVRAAETLGADLAYMGTRFIAAEESLAAGPYKSMLTESHMEDVFTSDAVTGAKANWLRPSLHANGVELSEDKPDIDFAGDMHADAKAWKHVWSAGHGVGEVAAVEPAADIVAGVIEEYRKAVIAERLHRTAFARRLGIL
ncbi:NAD(P)H-dependent flavin oxidoreductase [Haloglycomyces albus]|uniref:NAD(P)H-dependent flavin oxidoreductase n=1 Tax=Haloglycomyces albus TaxID=526067 RepID=UPI00046CFB5C|nr:nitronate monooxygenase [Haloglycomyces albus]